MMICMRACDAASFYWWLLRSNRVGGWDALLEGRLPKKGVIWFGAAMSDLEGYYLTNLGKPRTPSLPWEEPAFNGIFGETKRDAEFPCLSYEEVRLSSKPASAKRPAASSSVKLPCAKMFRGDDQAKDAKARAALMVDLLGMAAWSTEEAAIKLQLDIADSDASRIKVIEDTVARKATGTLKVRVASLKQFFDWKRERAPDDPVFLPSEAEVYLYVTHLRALGAFRSRSQRLVESLPFLATAFGFQCGWRASPRICGAISTMKSKYVVRRAPLSKHLVFKLEDYVIDDSNPNVLRIVAGYSLFLLHSRARFSDAARPVREPMLDVQDDGDGFVETETRISKTIKAKAFRGGALPLVALSLGASGRPWAKAWLDVRKLMGASVDKGQPLLPLQDRSGHWTSSSMSSAQFTMTMREIFTAMGVSPPDPFGSHSFKATLLSWCAKAAVDPRTRALLGYHVTGADLSVLTYSRDELAGPLRALWKV